MDTKAIILTPKDKFLPNTHRKPEPVLLLKNDNCRLDPYSLESIVDEEEVIPETNTVFFPSKNKVILKRKTEGSHTLGVSSSFQRKSILLQRSSKDISLRSKKIILEALPTTRRKSLLFDKTSPLKVPKIRVKDVEKLKANVVSFEASNFIKAEINEIEEKDNKTSPNIKRAKTRNSSNSSLSSSSHSSSSSLNSSLSYPSSFYTSNKTSNSIGVQINQGISLYGSNFSTKFGAPYRVQCDYCSGHFRISSIGEHIRKQHSVLNLIRCESCQKTFKSAENLRNHLVRSHLTCSICAKSCKTFQDLDRHHAESHNCHVCKKLFISKEKIKEHLMEVHLLCSLCYQGCNTLEELGIHLSTHPKCSICFKVMKNHGDLETHKTTHLKCECCKLTFQTVTAKRHHILLAHQCRDCNKVFESPEYLNSHRVSHRTCPICRTEFESSTKRNFHQKTSHFRCQLCSIIFKRLIDFEAHKTLTHPCN